MTAPLIPFVNDHELERILERQPPRGASGANYVLLRLPLELKELFDEWLEAHFPDRAAACWRASATAATASSTRLAGASG